MNYLKPKIKIDPKGLVKNLTVCLALIFATSLIFFSPISHSDALPDCAVYSGTPNPGVNCLYLGKPLCSTLNVSPQPRVNCADLIDLPLCSDIDNPANILTNKNCVKKCSDSSFNNPDPTKVRGVDYAIHNKNCIRFCDEATTEGVTPSSTNCVQKKCYQLNTSVTPDATSASANCTITPCNLLTPDELNDTRFDDSSKKYCDGSAKCYTFTKAQLPYLKLRATNTMCKIHDCTPYPVASPPICGVDDVVNITNKDASETGYSSVYIEKINAGLPLDNNTICTPVICKPVVQRQYRCTNSSGTIVGDSTDTTPNVNCDASGGGHVCSAINMCYKTIDCNKPENSSQDECATSISDSDAPPEDSFESTLNTWFYRPKPMDKALISSSTGILRNMESGLCYTSDQMDEFEPGGFLEILGINLGYFHSFILPGHSTSGGMCSADHVGSRGKGYIYLCGTDGLLYNSISEHSGFQKGYVRSVFTEGDAIHKVTFCLRFKNAMRPDAAGSGETCGSRECGVSCAFGSCTQACGYDICRELTITEKNSQDCMMGNDIFGGGDKSCMTTVDTYVRLRAVGYKNKICGFVDSKGQFAYNPMFFDGSETLEDGQCISGVKNTDGSCNGKNTNDSEEVATKFRTILKIPYIQSNQPSDDAQGYLTRDGRLFNKQECTNIALRVRPPRLYNLANVQNSTKLFSPPLYILNVRQKRGGIISNPLSSADTYGPTDFYYPEMEIKFGTSTQKLSLGLGFTGYEDEDHADSESFHTVTTTAGTITYSVEIFVRKEYGALDRMPKFCLYRKQKNYSGEYLAPVQVACVVRNYPEINNSTNLEKIIIDQNSNANYDDAKIKFKYFYGSGTDCAAGSNHCSDQVTLVNDVQATPACASDVEKYQVCAQREECSKLNIECIKNEVNLQQAKANGAPTGSYEAIRNDCQQNLLPICSRKKGIAPSDSATLYNQNPDNSAGSATAYGWFNEVCLVYGFETKLKTVLANKTIDGVKGKCVIDEANSPYITDGNASTNCDAGGKAPNCLCVEAVSGFTSYDSATQEIRKQTLREAGLCVDMPTPKLCSPIDYNQSPNSDSSDAEYVLYSLGKTSYNPPPPASTPYNSSSNVHYSHFLRTQGSVGDTSISGFVSHGEFAVGVVGMTNVEGTCTGFWMNKNGSLKPKLNCTTDGWVNAADPSLAYPLNDCQRYSCSVISTTGPDASGNYQGNYGASETGETKGASNGFATWPAHTLTSDYAEIETAVNCIAGFKRTGSTAYTSSGTSLSGSALTQAAINGTIDHYSGGSLPQRYCNQLGQWQEPTNVCERISCPAITATMLGRPTGSSGNNADGIPNSTIWDNWKASGGAIFPSVKASRSNARIQSESISYGTCETDQTSNWGLGFFNAGTAPSRTCDYNGNWGPVQNPCVSYCSEITDPLAAPERDGYAKWPQGSVPVGESESIINSSSCAPGYIPYPYSPYKDNHGNFIVDKTTGDAITWDGVLTKNTTRDGTNPRRACQSIVTVGGGTANIWTGTNSRCVNKCPGYDPSVLVSNPDGDPGDPRLGVGRTSHSTAAGTEIVNWPDTTFGTYAYVYGHFDPNSVTLSAADFQPGKTSNYYVLRRYCNSDGTWSTPEPICMAGGGKIGNATYSVTSSVSGVTDTAPFTGDHNSLPVGTTQLTGTCVANYWTASRGTAAAPKRKCSYASGNSYIDRVYWELDATTQDCELTSCQAKTINSDGLRTGATNVTAGNVTDKRYLNCASASEAPLSASLPAGVPATSGPYVACGTDGNWGAIQNAIACQRACNIPLSSVSGNRVNAYDCGDGYGYYSASIYGDSYFVKNYPHGSSVSFAYSDFCPDGADACNMHSYYVGCSDGTPIIRYSDGYDINADNDYGWCNKYQIYDSTSGTWSEGTDPDDGSNRNRLVFRNGSTKLSSTVTEPDQVTPKTNLDGDDTAYFFLNYIDSSGATKKMVIKRDP